MGHDRGRRVRVLSVIAEELAQQVARDARAIARGRTEVVDRRDLGDKRFFRGCNRSGRERVSAERGFRGPRRHSRRDDRSKMRSAC